MDPEQALSKPEKREEKEARHVLSAVCEGERRREEKTRSSRRTQIEMFAAASARKSLANSPTSILTIRRGKKKRKKKRARPRARKSGIDEGGGEWAACNASLSHAFRSLGEEEKKKEEPKTRRRSAHSRGKKDCRSALMLIPQRERREK